MIYSTLTILCKQPGRVKCCRQLSHQVLNYILTFLCLHILILFFPSDPLLSSTFFQMKISAYFCTRNTQPNLNYRMYFRSKFQIRIRWENPFSYSLRANRGSSGMVYKGCTYFQCPSHSNPPPSSVQWHLCHHSAPSDRDALHLIKDDWSKRSYLATTHKAILHLDNCCFSSDFNLS